MLPKTKRVIDVWGTVAREVGGVSDRIRISSWYQWNQCFPLLSCGPSTKADCVPGRVRGCVVIRADSAGDIST